MNGTLVNTKTLMNTGTLPPMRIVTPVGDILEMADHREAWIVAGVMFEWRIWRLADYDDRCRAAHHAADRYRRGAGRMGLLRRWWRWLRRFWR